jgi:hypothetical protein
LIDTGISLATTRTGTGAALPIAAVDGDAFVEQLNNETTTVAAGVTFLDVPVDGASRLYAPQPGNGRE